MAGKPGRKSKKTLEEQIEQITNDIETYKKSIATLEEKRQELLKQKRERDLSELYDAITDNGLTVTNVMEIIETYKNNKEITEESEPPKLNVV